MFPWRAVTLVLACGSSCNGGLHVSSARDAASVDGFSPESIGSSGGAGGTSGDGGATGAGGDALCDPRTGSAGGAWDCGSLTLSTTRRPTDVLLVLDRSGSMGKSVAEDCFCAAYPGDESGSLCSGTSVCTDRWSVVKTAVDRVIAEASGIAWGLQLVPSPGPPPSCLFSSPWDVPVSSVGGVLAQARIDTVTPAGSTPIDMAINAAVSHLGVLAEANSKVILLATDGEADCVGGSPSGASSALDASLNAIAAAYSEGYPVYVVGAGPGTDNLNRMAQAGGTGVYHPATSPEELLTDLAAISRTVASCTLDLPTPPLEPMNMAVYIDRQLVRQDPINGWTYDADASALVFSGAYCDRLANASNVIVQVLLGCPSSAAIPPCLL